MKKRACSRGILFFMMAALMAAPGSAGEAAGNEEPRVSINYQTGLIQPFGRIELAKGETLIIRIFNHPENCIFDVTGVVEPPPETKARKDGVLETSISIKHDSIYQSYKVTVKEKGTTESRSWVIPVFTHTWTLDFSGAFTFDWMINPVYYLDPGTQTDLQNVPHPGFIVRRNTKAEDAFGLGAAAMVHLYHTKFLHFLKKTFTWAPLSFGLGVGANTGTRYYLGTSIRVGDVIFLTAGAVFGKVDRLPANLTEGGFVADANALATLPKRSTAAIFLGISYAFAGTKAKEKLEQVFSVSSQTPTK